MKKQSKCGYPILIRLKLNDTKIVRLLSHFGRMERVKKSFRVKFTLYKCDTPPETYNIPTLACFVCMYRVLRVRVSWDRVSCRVYHV